jgi:hypothetical protein
MPDDYSLFHEALPLANKIAGVYAKIPSMPADGLRAVAHVILHLAALAFNPAK